MSHRSANGGSGGDELSPEKSPLIQERDNQFCVEYAPGLYFYQKDIDEFIRTKSAAHTMVEKKPALGCLNRSGASADL